MHDDDAPPPTSWRIDPLAVHDVARRIAKTAGHPIDPRTSEDMKAIHEKYLVLRDDHRKSFGESAEDARAMWIADLIFEMFADDGER